MRSTATGATEAARPAVQDAAAAARGLADAIEAQDAAIARLARNADPTEAARLRERLAALRESDDPESGALGELLTRQLALLDDMTARLAAARSARDRLFSALKGLWRAVDEYARGPADAEAARRLSAAGAGAAASAGQRRRRDDRHEGLTSSLASVGPKRVARSPHTARSNGGRIAPCARPRSGASPARSASRAP